MYFQENAVFFLAAKVLRNCLNLNFRSSFIPMNILRLIMLELSKNYFHNILIECLPSLNLLIYTFITQIILSYPKILLNLYLWSLFLSFIFTN